MPKQKLYAKWDIPANRNSLAAYFLYYVYNGTLQQ